MDRYRFSAIAHRNHAFSNPLSETKLMGILQKSDLQPQAKVIDIGAGKCELLIRLVEQYQVKATGIELYEGAIEEAKRNAEDRIPQDTIDFIVDDANAAVAKLSPGDFDLALCIGSTHALGGLKPTLQTLSRLVKKGGYLLIGEGYWKQSPDPAYLEALGGAEESELNSHAGNVMLAEELGLAPLWSYVTSDDEWDAYEWLYSSSIESFCYEHPDDPDREAMLERIRSWRRTYLTWGRDTLGFGLYLFRN